MILCVTNTERLREVKGVSAGRSWCVVSWFLVHFSGPVSPSAGSGGDQGHREDNGPPSSPPEWPPLCPVPLIVLASVFPPPRPSTPLPPPLSL